MEHVFSCLGFSFLGVCAYDPAKPTYIYFTLGDAVAALTITLIIPQFIKPIFMFRLTARKLPLPPLTALYMLVALGALSVLIGAVIVNLPVNRENTFAYPIFWEILGFLLFGVAYGYLTLSFLLPAPVRAGTYERFARAAAELLANADERDYVDFSLDLVRNVDRLVKCAMLSEMYPRQQRTAFFDFAHRREIVDAGSAASLLHIISDPTFCATLVRRCPWQAARIVLILCRGEISSRSVRKFVQELARLALLSDQGMMAREMEFGGFRAAPVLSNALFNDWFVAHEYEPFEGLKYGDFANLTRAFLDRFYRAVELTLTVTLSAKGYWDAANFIHIQSHHESLMMEVNRIARSGDRQPGIIISAHFGLRKIIRITREQLAKLDARTRRSLYVENTQNKEHRDFTLLDDIAEVIYDSITTISNEFQKAPNDPFWTFALDVLGDTFPRYGNPPRGMDPLQQRVAVKILDKLDDNMTGWYPAVSRVVLAVIGPYGKHSNLDEGCALRLFERGVYFRLKELPKLAATNAEKYRDFLPENVRLDTYASRLIHTYTLGEEESTDLTSLEIGAVSLSASDVAV